LTKTEYREYLCSDAWQSTRKDFLFFHDKCNECHIPRWLAKIVYDQDLHVHHRNYKSLGDEIWDDLEALCRRCHEMRTFGHSDIEPPKTFQCSICNEPCFDPYLNPPLCLTCWHVQCLSSLPAQSNTQGDIPLWERLISVVFNKVKTDDIIDHLAWLEDRRAKRKNQPCPF
jgi:HNH endonuclease